MSSTPKHIQFEDFIDGASTIFDEVASSNEEVIVERGETLFSIRRKRLRKARTAHHLTPNDPLFDIIGIGHSSRTDVSANKHRYLAEAIADESDSDTNV